MVVFFTVRLLATDDARYWLGIGAGIGLLYDDQVHDQLLGCRSGCGGPCHARA